MTDYEKLSLEVWTNGAITPQDAIGLASKLVKDHMSIFINFEESRDLPEEVVENYNDPRLDHLDRSVEELELSCPLLQLPEERKHSEPTRAGPEDRIRNAEDEKFRRKSLNEIKEILQKMGLSLGMNSTTAAASSGRRTEPDRARSLPEETAGL